jgi:23S rRNA (adenine2503-C2)-methyltransferase
MRAAWAARADMPLDVLGLTAENFAEAARLVLPSGAGLSGDLFRKTYLSGAFTPEAFTFAPSTLTAWRAHFSVAPLRVVRTAEEDTDLGLTAKAVLATSDGREIECVRIPMREDGQHTLCISSQVGCRMGCAFCETGRMGLIRNLSAAEIVNQVFTAWHVLGWQPRNLVFMGMGEALDNADAVLQAIRVLTDRRGFHFSLERITVCTSGHADGLRQLAAAGWRRLNLSVSLNAPDDAARNRLMPVNRRTDLAALQALLIEYPKRRNFVLGVNYCLMPGLNDGPEAAAGIAEFCRPLGRVLINLIPYNPGTQPIARAPSEDEVIGFIARLREAGLPVRRRVTKGRTIMAACGQLGDPAARRREKTKATITP